MKRVSRTGIVFENIKKITTLEEHSIDRTSSTIPNAEVLGAWGGRSISAESFHLRAIFGIEDNFVKYSVNIIIKLVLVPVSFYNE